MADRYFHHPRYVHASNGFNVHRIALIGDIAHSAVTGQTGTIIAIGEHDVTIRTNTARCAVGIEYLCYGPAPEPEPPLLAIRPTWAELRRLVALVDRYDHHGGQGRELIGTVVVDAIPADIAARLRAENKAAGR